MASIVEVLGSLVARIVTVHGRTTGLTRIACGLMSGSLAATPREDRPAKPTAAA